MANPTIGADPSLSLADLEAWLWGQESLFGPVIAIGNDGDQTAATFDRSKPRPKSKARIVLSVGGASVAPQGTNEVCRGTVFISGAQLEVVVYR